MVVLQSLKRASYEANLQRERNVPFREFISCEKTASHEQIKVWIIAHGGEFVTEVSESTTHLICSIEDFKKRTEQGMTRVYNSLI
jgi:hypothetical protein